MNFSWLLPAITGIPVLMYHKVWPGQCNDLTISPESLKEQWEWLRGQGYKPLSITDFIQYVNAGGSYPDKSFLITFDDGYMNNFTYVYPLLKEFGWRATFFIISSTLEGNYRYGSTGADELMSLPHLRQLDPKVVQLAVHGYQHEHFSKLDVNEIKRVMQQSVDAFEQSQLPYNRILAYPYGSRPQNGPCMDGFRRWMEENKFAAAFRIGNQVCKVPAPDIFNIRRIDIKGTDTVKELKIKLQKGKLRPF